MTRGPVDQHLSLAQVAHLMSGRFSSDSPEAVQGLLRACLEFLPGAICAGVSTVVHGAEVQTAVATDERARLLDEIAARHQDGPCLAIAGGSDDLYIADVRADHRWPTFGREVSACSGVRSMVLFRLSTTRTTTEVLTFASDRCNAFDDVSRDVARLLAVQVALSWSAAQRAEQFREALASRDIIGQAKGMIMERYGVDAGQAFELLRRLSQDSNVRIAELSRQVVAGSRSESGALGADGPPPFSRPG